MVLGESFESKFFVTVSTPHSNNREFCKPLFSRMPATIAKSRPSAGIYCASYFWMRKQVSLHLFLRALFVFFVMSAPVYGIVPFFWTNASFILGSELFQVGLAFLAPLGIHFVLVLGVPAIRRIASFLTILFGPFATVGECLRRMLFAPRPHIPGNLVFVGFSPAFVGFGIHGDILP